MNTKPIAILADLKIRRPRYETSQESAIHWLATAYALSKLGPGADETDFVEITSRMERLARHYGCSSGTIRKRGHDLPDFTHFSWDEMKLYRLHENPRGAPTSVRMRLFQQYALDAFRDFYADHTSREAPAEVIHVTCTGYCAPSSAEALVSEKGWQDITHVTHAYHMGCHAAIPALRIAAGLIRLGRGNGRADIVHTELCTLHMDPSYQIPEQVVIQSLFADGYAKYTIKAEKNNGAAPGFELLGLQASVIPSSLDAMTWIATEVGMQMTLSREVPALVESNIREFVLSLFHETGLDYEREKKNAIFAIHPGGPRIINGVQEALRLDDFQVAFSKTILFEYGNMSSATLPHVWDRVLKSSEIQDGTLVVSLAFGPGLTVAGNILRKIS